MKPFVLHVHEEKEKKGDLWYSRSAMKLKSSYWWGWLKWLRTFILISTIAIILQCAMTCTVYIQAIFAKERQRECIFGWWGTSGKQAFFDRRLNESFYELNLLPSTHLWVTEVNLISTIAVISMASSRMTCTSSITGLVHAKAARYNINVNSYELSVNNYIYTTMLECCCPAAVLWSCTRQPGMA